MIAVELNDNSGYIIYRIEKFEQYEAIKEKLLTLIAIVSTYLYETDSVSVFQSYIERNLRNKNPNFALWISSNKKTNEIIGYWTTLIATEVNDSKSCVIKDMYCSPSFMNFKRTLLYAFDAINDWARDRSANRVMFALSNKHRVKTFERLLGRKNFEIKTYIFSKETY